MACVTAQGRKVGKGESYGADDVLLRTQSYRAFAATYLHVLSVGAETFEALRLEHKEGFLLTKL